MPFEGTTRPSTKCPNVEAGLVYATVASVVPKGEVREQSLALLRELDGEKIVGNRSSELNRFNARGSDVVHSILWNSLRAVKKRNRRLRRRGHRRRATVLPGRDVWAWEVLARRQSMRTYFNPVISRSVARDDQALLESMRGWPLDWSRALVFDTGFSGSIHRAICRVTHKRPDLLLLSGTNQIFPNHSGSRAKALAIEYFPKYWRSGCVREGMPVQYLATLEEFIRAAALTIWLWHHKSPRRISPQLSMRKWTGPWKVKSPNAGTTTPTITMGTSGALTVQGNIDATTGTIGSIDALSTDSIATNAMFESGVFQITATGAMGAGSTTSSTIAGVNWTGI
jgi:hypothetical protein